MKDKTFWIVLIIFLLGFGLRVHLLDHQSLWWDEAKTISRAFDTFPDLFTDILSKRHHLPLFFLITRPWVSMTGQSEFSIRFLSVLFGVVSMPVVYRAGSLIGGRKAGLIAAVLLAISPFHIWYSQEARMYTMVTLFVLAAHYFLFRLLRNNSWKNWLGYFVFILLALYTHLFVLLILMVHYVFFTLYYRFLKPLTVRWFVTAVFLGFLFSGWVFVILSTGGVGEATPPWIVSVSWYEPFLTLVAFSAGRTVDLSQFYIFIVPVVFFVFLVGTLKLARGGQENLTLKDDKGRLVFQTRLLYFWLVIPVLLTFVVSLDWPINQRFSIYTDRYLIIVLPALILLVSLGLARLNSWVGNGRIVLAILVLITLFTLPGLYNLYYEPYFGKEDWRSVAGELQDGAMAGDVLWSRLDHQTPLAYYLNDGDFSADWYLIPLVERDDPDFEGVMRQLLADGAGGADRIWIITQYYNNDLHGFPADRNEEVAQAESLDPQLAWLLNNFERVEKWEFPGIQMSLFEVSD